MSVAPAAVCVRRVGYTQDGEPVARCSVSPSLMRRRWNLAPAKFKLAESSLGYFLQFWTMPALLACSMRNSADFRRIGRKIQAETFTRPQAVVEGKRQSPPQTVLHFLTSASARRAKTHSSYPPARHTTRHFFPASSSFLCWRVCARCQIPTSKTRSNISLTPQALAAQHLRSALTLSISICATNFNLRRTYEEKKKTRRAEIKAYRSIQLTHGRKRESWYRLFSVVEVSQRCSSP